MKKKMFRFKNYVVATAVFIAAVIVAILLFFACVQSSVRKNSKTTMMNNVSRQSEHLRSVLRIHYQYLTQIAEEMAKGDDLFAEDNLVSLTSIHNHTDLERVALIEMDGTAHYDTGAEKNVSHRRYFMEASNGQETLSDPLESSVDQEVRVVLGVPVFKDDSVIGILGGSYNVTALSHMLFEDLFGGKGYSLITDKKGKVIAYDRIYTAVEQEGFQGNVFEYYQRHHIQTKAIEDIKKDFEAGREGIGEFRLTEGRRPAYYMAYTPLKMNDWMICYVVPVAAAQASYNFIRHYEIALMVSFVVMASMLIGYIVYKNNQEKARLLSSAQRDALTGLYNKKATQDLIEKVLDESSAKVCNALLIMDVDYFKQVNDTYGHIVGDKVLKTFGQLLFKQFREQDIVGRIGGDEFMVLIRNIGNVEIAENRVKKLVEEVRNMQIPEMDGKGITISAGIAFSPDHGTTFMELYRHADTALYQIKRDGRNGYSTYEKISQSS